MAIKFSRKDHKALEFTYREYVDYAENRKHSKEHSMDTSTEGSSSWTGSKSMAHALKLARNGWDAGIKQLEVELGTEEKLKIETHESPHGSAVNMENYLLGMPDAMYNFENTTDYDREELIIYVRTDLLGNVKLEQAMKFCMSIIKTVNKYQSKYNVKLVAVSMVRWGLFSFDTFVTIKETDESFVLNNVAFSFHPSFDRRLWFSVAEGEDNLSWGYGSPRSNSELVNHAKNEAGAYSKAMVLPSINEVNGEFKESMITKINF